MFSKLCRFKCRELLLLDFVYNWNDSKTWYRWRRRKLNRSLSAAAYIDDSWPTFKFTYQDWFHIASITSNEEPVHTMAHEGGPWKMAFFHGLTWWSNFHGPISLKNQLTKSLGPSVGVNRMWTKRYDHALKRECVDFFNIVSKGQLWKK